MTETQLIRKIKVLKKIEPKEDWVLLTKEQILGQENPVSSRLSLGWKLAFATFVTILVLFGNFNFVQKSLPGDFLYPLKRISERGQVAMVSQANKPKIQLEIANKRLEELEKIARANQTQKLAAAINEFKLSTKEAAKNLTQAVKTEKDSELIKEVVLQTQKLEEQKKKVEALGIVIGENKEFENALKELVKREIDDIEKRELTEEQGEIIESIKLDFEEENYSQALEKILILNQSR